MGLLNKLTAEIARLEVVYRPISDLQPDPRNARTHPRKQLRMATASLRKFGFANPILIDGDGRIIGGHLRHLAAKELGLQEVPTICLGYLSEAERRAYAIADNKIAEKAGWDREILAAELEIIIADKFEIQELGFEPGEIEVLQADLAQDTSDPSDECPASPIGPPVSGVGDLWVLGKDKGRVLCADARCEVSITALMSGQQAAMVFTDPPYNVRIAGHVQGRGRIKHREFAVASGELSDDEFDTFLITTLSHAAKVCRDGGLLYVCMDWRHLENLYRALRTIDGTLLNLVVWNKTNAGQGSFYRSQHELIAVFALGMTSHQNNVELGKHGRNRSNVWTYAGVNSFGRDRDNALAMHPTVKPVALVADAIRDCTSRGDLVFDPFLGSGTTLMAAEKVGRRCFGMEIDPAYVDVIVRRWQAHTKADAVLAGDGRTFDEIALERCAQGTKAMTEKRIDDEAPNRSSEDWVSLCFSPTTG